jgi:hypothetical protein
VPEYTKFRFGGQTLADLAALAVSAGSATQAAREAIAHWRRVVEAAGRQNAEALSEDDWARLGHLNDPSPLAWTWDEDERAAARDWSKWLAAELTGAWEGRDVALPEHKAEAKAGRELARRVASWGPVRGYALFACLRAFWSRPDTPEAWWRPEVWMTPAG